MTYKLMTKEDMIEYLAQDDRNEEIAQDLIALYHREHMTSYEREKGYLHSLLPSGVVCYWNRDTNDVLKKMYSCEYEMPTDKRLRTILCGDQHTCLVYENDDGLYCAFVMKEVTQ